MKKQYVATKIYLHSYSNDNAKFILVQVNVLKKYWIVYIKIYFDASKTKQQQQKILLKGIFMFILEDGSICVSICLK